MNSNSKLEEQTTEIVPFDQEGTEAYPGDLVPLFCKRVLEGRWDSVVFAYEIDSHFHRIKIDESKGTALHVAVNNGKEDWVNLLVDAIIEHEGGKLGDESALRSTNARGDTPLHLAAYRGFNSICKRIIGENGERKDLIKVLNIRGETPLFCAGLTCQMQTFVYMYHVSKSEVDVPLRNHHGDSILHIAIRREFLGTEAYTDEIPDFDSLFHTSEISMFRGGVLEGRWKKVIPMYVSDSFFHKIEINESRSTALHLAANSGEEKLVNILVGAIIEHEGEELSGESALRSTNERGDTPLHLAASRGFIGMCKCIIGENGKRKDLIKVRNNKGETPLFCAVLTCQTETFVYMNYASKSEVDVPLRNHDGDSILHLAIQREFFDLAIIIIHCYPILTSIANKDGVTPLKTLATRSSAFKSGSNLTWWKQILYQCIIVESLDAKKEMKSYLDKTEREGIIVEPLDAEEELKSYLDIIDETEDHEPKGHPKTKDQPWLCCIVPVTIRIETEVKEEAHTRVLRNYVTSLRSVFKTIRSALSGRGLSQLDISVMDMLHLKKIQKIKQKHIWGNQLLQTFMECAPESYIGITGGQQPFWTDDLEDIPSLRQLESLHPQNAKMETANSTHQKPQENKKQSTEEKTRIIEIENDLQTKFPRDQHGTTQDKANLLLAAMMNIKNKLPKNIDKKETAYLTAAKNGIVEIENVLRSKIPSVVSESNSNNENALLLAVKNRQPHVVKVLHKKLDEKIFYSLLFEVDDRENTVLHLAAGTVNNNEKSWRTAGAAMQMMWDLKWYQYIKELVPEHFMFRNNRDDKTAGEIFKENHKDLVEKSSQWLKETSESCSVVAALIAGVSFATCSSVPGGTEKGKPELEGQPEFDTFAIASLIGLCFSVTALVMFLSIITSRKQAEDFRRSLPAKLLVGMSSLFVSITSLLVSFCAAHFFVLKDKYKNILFPIYVATCLPATFFAVVQFPLYVALVRAIIKKVPQRSYRSDHL